jgi:hypothetical protein
MAGDPPSGPRFARTDDPLGDPLARSSSIGSAETAASTAIAPSLFGIVQGSVYHDLRRPQS